MGEVTMDQSSNIVALNYAPQNPSCAAVDASQLQDSVVNFDTTVKLAYPWRGIRPDVKPGQGAPQQQHMGDASPPQGNMQGDGKQGQGEGEPKEEQSFLRKYWLYIAIPVVYLMMSGLPPEEGAAPAAGGRPGAPRAAPRRRPTA